MIHLLVRTLSQYPLKKLFIFIFFEKVEDKNSPRLHAGKTSPPQPPEPSASSPADRVHYNDSMGFVSHSINLLLQCFQNKHSTIDNKFLLWKPYEDVHGGLGSHSLGVSIEKQRTNVNVNEIPTEVLMEELRNNLVNDGVRVNEANVMVTPGNSGMSYFSKPYHLVHVLRFLIFMIAHYAGDEVRSIPSSGSGHGTSDRLVMSCTYIYRTMYSHWILRWVSLKSLFWLVHYHFNLVPHQKNL